MIVLNVGFEALTIGDTMANVLGFILIATFVFISYKTKCLTKIKIKK